MIFGLFTDGDSMETAEERQRKMGKKKESRTKEELGRKPEL